jgi:acetyl esterase/lipase
VVYNTIDANGAPTRASGLMIVPLNNEIDEAPLIVYHHGTIADDASIPSNLGLDALVGYAAAIDGYIVLLPDYLGLGESDGIHPYLHALSEATASIDMVRASRQALAGAGIPLNGQVFLTGYSP